MMPDGVMVRTTRGPGTNSSSMYGVPSGVYDQFSRARWFVSGKPAAVTSCVRKVRWIDSVLTTLRDLEVDDALQAGHRELHRVRAAAVTVDKPMLRVAGDLSATRE